jgi:hypothetical protein
MINTSLPAFEEETAPVGMVKTNRLPRCPLEFIKIKAKKNQFIN